MVSWEWKWGERAPLFEREMRRAQRKRVTGCAVGREIAHTIERSPRERGAWPKSPKLSFSTLYPRYFSILQSGTSWDGMFSRKSINLSSPSKRRERFSFVPLRTACYFASFSLCPPNLQAYFAGCFVVLQIAPHICAHCKGMNDRELDSRQRAWKANRLRKRWKEIVWTLAKRRRQSETKKGTVKSEVRTTVLCSHECKKLHSSTKRKNEEKGEERRKGRNSNMTKASGYVFEFHIEREQMTMGENGMCIDA